MDWTITSCPISSSVCCADSCKLSAIKIFIFLLVLSCSPATAGEKVLNYTSILKALNFLCYRTTYDSPLEPFRGLMYSDDDWRKMSEERETLDWGRYGSAARELAQIVADDNYQPDIILAIARGGLFVAGSLGYALSVKNLYVMNVEYYTGVEERLDVPVALPPYLDSIDLT